MTVPPVPERVPTVELPPTIVSTVQVTPVSLVPVTVAVKERLPEVATLAVAAGLRTRTTTGAVTVTVAEALRVVSPTLWARMVWVPAARGAV